MNRSRGKLAIVNTLFALIAECAAVICGFIVPRLILGAFGSAYNGISTSITQFLSCAVLLRSGIGGATRAALYKPLHEGDFNQINSIMSATNKFMQKIALIIGGLILAFSLIYPFMVIKEFSWLFSFSLFLIIGVSTFFESLFGITYQILLQADQRVYITSIVHTIVYITNTVLSVVLIYAGCGIHIVKLGSAFAFTLYPIILNIYVRKRYKIDLSVKPDNQAINQRWDAFFHQAAGFVMNNTDTVILTIFSTLSEVSVYSVYNLVILGVNRLMNSFTNGLEAAFGSMIASKDKNNLEINFNVTTFLIFTISTLLCSCSFILIIPFVKLYTNGITDAEYVRPAFAFLIITGQFFNSIRQPYQLLIQADGKYKDTKKIAILEPTINIVISIIMVIKFGLVGVAIGTIIAIVFRTVVYSHFVSTQIIDGIFMKMVKKIVLASIEIMISYTVYRILPIPEPTSYSLWCLYAVIAALITIAVIFIFSTLFERDEQRESMNKIKRSIMSKRGK